MSKKILLGVTGLAIATYFFRDKLFGNSTTKGESSTVVIDRGYSVTYPGAPNGAVWQVINGKRFAFISEAAYNAFQALGATPYSQSTSAEVEAIPAVGFVDSDGRAKDNNGGVFS